VDVACGDAHSIARTNDGSLYLFGGNGNGELGASPIEIGDQKNKPRRLRIEPQGTATSASTIRNNNNNNNNNKSHSSLVSLAQMSSSVRFVDAACGGNFSVALAENGLVSVWGMARDGQLGKGDFVASYVPVLLPSFLSMPIVSVACGRSHTLFATISGDVFATGSNVFGQLGISIDHRGCYRPVNVPTLQGSQVGMTHSLTHSLTYSLTHSLTHLLTRTYCGMV
jgi:alpha-tubulin suppressor-like RCC1 family protein